MKETLASFFPPTRFNAIYNTMQPAHTVGCILWRFSNLHAQIFTHQYAPIFTQRNLLPFVDTADEHYEPELTRRMPLFCHALTCMPTLCNRLTDYNVGLLTGMFGYSVTTQRARASLMGVSQHSITQRKIYHSLSGSYKL